MLKHSHSLFKKRTDHPTGDLSDSDSEIQDSKPRTSSQNSQNHVNAPAEPSPSAAQQQPSGDTESSDEESVSASALEEELERAEFEPFMDDGKYVLFGPCDWVKEC